MDVDGKKFDKVSRMVCKSDLYEFDMKLDVNVDIYPLEVGDKFSLALAPTLNLDGSDTTMYFDASMQHASKTLMDKFEYVMYGKVFKYSEAAAGGGVNRVDVYISFGGLLMLLNGDAKKLQELDVDSNVYLLMRKVK